MRPEAFMATTGNKTSENQVYQYATKLLPDMADCLRYYCLQKAVNYLKKENLLSTGFGRFC
jgi:hypothetical protein